MACLDRAVRSHAVCIATTLLAAHTCGWHPRDSVRRNEVYTFGHSPAAAQAPMAHTYPALPAMPCHALPCTCSVAVASSASLVLSSASLVLSSAALPSSWPPFTCVQYTPSPSPHPVEATQPPLLSLSAPHGPPSCLPLTAPSQGTVDCASICVCSCTFMACRLWILHRGGGRADRGQPGALQDVGAGGPGSQPSLVLFHFLQLCSECRSLP